MESPPKKRLYRSTSNKMIAGVCGGIAEYLNVDPTIVRIAWILLSILPLIPGIVIYIIAWFVIPKAPGGTTTRSGDGGRNAAAILGIMFIAIGGLIFLGNLDILDWEDWWDVSWEYVFPLLLIAIGVLLMARPARTAGPSEPGAESASAAQAPPVFNPGLRRSKTDRKIAGVCGGLAAYLGVDVSVIRVAFVFFTLWPFGLGAVVYLIMLLVVPEENVVKA
jgi:phage shock protein C